ncbi:MAG: hypothetical protein Q8S12_11605 [Hydrogenophaga sp.]|uniref:hypothetical protein n=1 Tax=Hydrogenophaga sp. TaxID=1904254 RepID=UPI002732C41E|nr:hypothetical protein [Hydrogenophaga sp.]MDP3627236.1 hypothetical protein [Hydrogenophaga sp.]
MITWFFTSADLAINAGVLEALEHWMARSYNREFPDLQIDDGEPISVIGRALWMGAKL